MLLLLLHPLLLLLQVDPADHCETPLDAYQMIAPALHMLAERLGKAPAALAVYDPYFCQVHQSQHAGR